MLKKLTHPYRIQQLFALLHQLLMAGYGFLLLFVLIRILSHHELGRWLLFLSGISIGDMLLHGLLQTTVIKEVSVLANRLWKIRTTSTNALIPSLMIYASVACILWLVKIGFSIVGMQFELLNDLAHWYPILALPMVFYNISWWVHSGLGNFRFVFFQRLALIITTVASLLIFYYLNHSLHFNHVAFSLFIGYALSALAGFVVASYLRVKLVYVSKNKLKANFNYGKYTIGTMLGGSLLRNADTFMIAAFMSSSAVAIYTLAQKLIEVFEIILRTAASTSLPILFKMSHDAAAFAQKLVFRIVSLTVLFTPAAIAVFIFSDQIINLLSGGDPAYQISASILRIFVVYILLLPCDRMLGVALEALNFARLNLFKTLILVGINLTGNFIALYVFKSLPAVAAVSSLALIGAIITGILFLKNKVTAPSLKALLQHLNHGRL